ncbi:MAG: hypothetical protein ACRCSN_17485 [Dermatophilaceae bacterium]
MESPPVTYLTVARTPRDGADAVEGTAFILVLGHRDPHDGHPPEPPEPAPGGAALAAPALPPRSVRLGRWARRADLAGIDRRRSA